VFLSLGIAPVVRIEEADDPINHKIINAIQTLFQNCEDHQKQDLKSKPLLMLFNRK